MSHLPRLAAAMLVGGAVALSGAGVAFADPYASPSTSAAPPAAAVTGTQVYLDEPSSAAAIKVINSKKTTNNTLGNLTGTPRLGLKVAGATEPVRAYCIDFSHDIKTSVYVEGTWKPVGNKTPTEAELGKVLWVLTHSHPTVSVDSVITAAKGTKPAGANALLLEKLVYAGTQSAIWTLTDGDLFALRETNAGLNTGSTAEEYALIVAVSKYLATAAEHPAVEPQPKLAITPATLSGEAGKKIGPFTVESGGGTATLTAVGGKLVDAAGKDVTTLPGGGKFYVVADATGTVQVKAKGSGSVPIGRVFVNQAERDASQKLILAGVAGTELEASATVTVTPPVPHAPVPNLPVTGMKLTGAIAAGVVLVAGGAGLLLMVRRRRVRFTA